jgi:capsular polysaccharide biosynthesis protein
MVKSEFMNEITLKDIITIFVKQWKFITIFLSVITTITIIYNFFVLVPIYESKIELVVNVPETVMTEFGAYDFVIDNSSEYYDLIKERAVLNETLETIDEQMTYEAFSSKFSISQMKDSNIAVVSYRGISPSENAMILKQHIDNYSDFIIATLKKDATNGFVALRETNNVLFEQELNDLEKHIIDLESELNNMTPVIRLKKSLLSDSDASIAWISNNGNTNDLDGKFIIEEVINENYIEVEKLITQRKTQKNVLIQKIEKNRVELEILQKKQDDFIEAGSQTIASSEYLSALSTPIKVLSDATVPNNKIGPKRALNVIAMFIVSTIVVMLLVLFREYWQRA